MDNKKLKSSWAAAFTVASVWFGTHVGAGFATGNQVVNYFVQYGWTAAIFPLLAMGILAVVMYIMMKFAKLNGFDNYKDTYRALYPKPWMEVFFEVFYIIIILAAVASCVDGAGGIVKSLIDLPDIICNLVIIALLILLSIFGVDLIIKASTVLSTAILIVTAILVIMGFVVPIDAVAQELATENAAYASIPAIADVTSQKGLEGVWRGVFVYAAFQCVSVPAMIAASTELTHKGVKRASILGWLMNGGALAASGAMLLRWYPILCAIKSTGVDTVASIAARHIGDVMKLQPERCHPHGQRLHLAVRRVHHPAVLRVRVHVRHAGLLHDPALRGSLLPEGHQEQGCAQRDRRPDRHRPVLCSFPARPVDHHLQDLRL